MPTGFIQIKGAKELDRKLKSLDVKVAKGVTKKASREAGKVVLPAVRKLAPKLTGALKKAVKVRAFKRSRKGRVGVSIGAREGDFKGDQFYAAFVEFGHATGKRASNEDLGVGRHKRRTQDQKAEAERRNAGRKKVAAVEFMRRAFQATKQAALDKLIAALRAGIAAATRG